MKMCLSGQCVANERITEWCFLSLQGGERSICRRKDGNISYSRQKIQAHFARYLFYRSQIIRGGKNKFVSVNLFLIPKILCKKWDYRLYADLTKIGVNG